MQREKPNYQKRYRLSKTAKGFTRIEFSVYENTKARFEQMVKQIADEYMHPYNERGRESKAKTALFDQMVRGVEPKFLHMKEQIEGLQAELKASAPSFFGLKNVATNTPMPHTISQLPDNPDQLKTLLAQTHIKAQKAEKEAREYKRLYKQQQELASALMDFNSKLKGKLKNADIDIDDQINESENDW